MATPAPCLRSVGGAQAQAHAGAAVPERMNLSLRHPPRSPRTNAHDGHSPFFLLVRGLCAAGDGAPSPMPPSLACPIAWKARRSRRYDTESLIPRSKTRDQHPRTATAPIRTVEADDRASAGLDHARQPRGSGRGRPHQIDMLAPMLDELDRFEWWSNWTADGHYRRVRNLDAVCRQDPAAMLPAGLRESAEMFDPRPETVEVEHEVLALARPT